MYRIALTTNADWSRVHRRQEQLQWASISLLFLSACYAVFYCGYYAPHCVSIFEGAVLTSISPIAVALLAYLRGQRTVSELRPFPVA